MAGSFTGLEPSPCTLQPKISPFYHTDFVFTPAVTQELRETLKKMQEALKILL